MEPGSKRGRTDPESLTTSQKKARVVLGGGGDSLEEVVSAVTLLQGSERDEDDDGFETLEYVFGGESGKAKGLTTYKLAALTLNSKQHPRNEYRFKPPDFGLLAAKYPNFEPL
jgi:hypothetical protein